MKYTPHEVVFGRVVRGPTSSTLADDKSNESYSEYATTLFNTIFGHISTPKSRTYKLRSKQYYYRKIYPQAFNKDDYVLLLKEPLKGKFDEQYKRPYKILGYNNLQ